MRKNCLTNLSLQKGGGGEMDPFYFSPCVPTKLQLWLHQQRLGLFLPPKKKFWGGEREPHSEFPYVHIRLRES